MKHIAGLGVDNIRGRYYFKLIESTFNNDYFKLIVQNLRHDLLSYLNYLKNTCGTKKETNKQTKKKKEIYLNPIAKANCCSSDLSMSSSAKF